MATSKALGNVFKLRNIIDVMDPRFGAKGDGTTDDTTAIQAAIDFARAVPNGELYFPPNVVSAAYKVTAPLTITGPMKIRGAGPNAVTLMGIGMSAGQHILDFNCQAVDVVEHIEVSGLTLRSDNGSPNGLRLKNTSYVLVKDVLVRSLTEGVAIDGTRCFTLNFEGLHALSVTRSVRFMPGFAGGAQYNFQGCSFTGDAGLHIGTTAGVANINLNGCNFEQCTTNGIFVGGLCVGLSITGCEFEGCNGADISLVPAGAAEHVKGFFVGGCRFDASDSGSATRINMGGGLGPVRGFGIVGNVVTHGSNSYATAFVTLNGDGQSGVIAGNVVHGTTGGGAAIVNAVRPGVLVTGNENLTGALEPTWNPTLTTQTYTVTNPSTDRALNVSADTTAQGLAVLGTLIADLQAAGIIK